MKVAELYHFLYVRMCALLSVSKIMSASRATGDDP